MPWDSTMRGGKSPKTDAELAHIVYSRFNEKDTKAGVKFSLAGLYVYPYITHVSRNALKAIRDTFPEAIVQGRGIDHKKLSPRRANVTFEHVIPVEASYQYLNERAKQGVLTENDIIALMPKLLLAIITTDENKKLTAAGFHSVMPTGWWDSPLRDPLERYRKSGLLDRIWVNGFAG